MEDDIVIGPEEGTETDEESAVEALRGMPVGTNDPNIVGDAGPLDVPPGTDPPQDGSFTDGTAEDLPSV